MQSSLAGSVNGSFAIRLKVINHVVAFDNRQCVGWQHGMDYLWFHWANHVHDAVYNPMAGKRKSETNRYTSVFLDL